jgi:hypothetical protein
VINPIALIEEKSSGGKWSAKDPLVWLSASSPDLNGRSGQDRLLPSTTPAKISNHTQSPASNLYVNFLSGACLFASGLETCNLITRRKLQFELWIVFEYSTYFRLSVSRG